ncbi:MAG: nucleotidyl transferase AbiEii/AbiGii toxin family protein [Candidatus Omnitrophota bacterium]|nr:nucleotidyl transferase AbiEii/AbiGii toxin family protein [Candidatus Omnitrophota bacterium]
MIPSEEINAAAVRFEVPAETIEKDYAICWALNCMAAGTSKNGIVFYGGTAVKRIYFEDHRFSEDVDLVSEKDFKSDDLAQILTDGFALARKEANLSFEIDPSKTLSDDSRTRMFMRYSGYDEIVGAPKEIQIDFAHGREMAGETENRKIIETYTDLEGKGHVLKVQTLNTILAAKLGLLMDGTRKEPRDVFDIWFLLNRLDQFDFNLDRVREAFKQKHGFYPALSVLRPHLHNRMYEERWETRLKKQISRLPEIKIVMRDIEAKLKKVFGHANETDE